MVVKLSGYTRSLFSFVLAATALQGTGLIVLPTPPAIAQTTARAEVLLEPSEEESYKVFIARAEANAAVKAQSLFDQDLLRTEVRVTILGQRSAAIAPVLQLRVSRQEWTAYPDPEIWSVYYPESKNLLLFDESPLILEEEPDETVTEEPEDELEMPADMALPEDMMMPEVSPVEPLPGEVILENEDAELESEEPDAEPAPEEESAETTEEEATSETVMEEPEEDDDDDRLPSRTVPTLVR